MGYANEVTQTNNSVVTLRGRVLGADTNQPLVYASVTVKNSNISSVTNQDGYFSIRVPLSAKILNLSFAILATQIKPFR